MKVRTALLPSRGGFSLVEALITIALLGILAAIVVSSYTDASSQSHGIIAKQQTATLKSALDSYVMGQLSHANGGAGYQPGTAASVRTSAQLRLDYNSAVDTAARFALISGYIANESLKSAEHEGGLYVEGGFIKSASLVTDKKQINLPDWVAGSYPQVQIVDVGN